MCTAQEHWVSFDAQSLQFAADNYTAVYGTLRHQRDDSRRLEGVYINCTGCEFADFSLLYWLYQWPICQFIMQKCTLKSLLYGCYASQFDTCAEFTADNFPAVYATLCHQHLDSEEDGKGPKATLNMKLKTCSLRHIDHTVGCTICQFAKGAHKCPLCAHYVPSMCPFSEPELAQNSQQATSQHYITKGRHQGLRTVLAGQGHWYFFRQLKCVEKAKVHTKKQN